jgi:hypothetical protein
VVLEQATRTWPGIDDVAGVTVTVTVAFGVAEELGQRVSSILKNTQWQSFKRNQAK